jgi:hypothetical protein
MSAVGSPPAIKLYVIFCSWSKVLHTLLQ